MRFAPLALFLLATPFGCSSPVPATPETAWFLNLTSGGASCNLSNSVGKMGDTTLSPPGFISDQQSVTNATTGKMNLATVTCSVVANGSGFKVSGHAALADLSVTFSIPMITASASTTTPAVGSVSYVSANTVAVYTATDCNFYFPNPGMTVDTGKIWAAFDCPMLEDGTTSPPSVCSVPTNPQSIVAFENCATM